MSRRPIWSRPAQLDLRDITIASRALFGKRQADQTAARLRITCERLASTSMLGRERPEFRDHLRSFAVAPHVFFYFPTARTIRVVRILHGARSMPPQLFDPASDES